MPEFNLEDAKEELIKELKERAKIAIAEGIANVLSDGDVIVLSGLGIDAKRIMLETFIVESQNLLNEDI